MTRTEHLTWCKKRAMDEFNYYEPREGFEAAARNAKASMLSDLGKHAETKDSQQTAALFLLMPMRSKKEIVDFIDGFN